MTLDVPCARALSGAACRKVSCGVSLAPGAALTRVREAGKDSKGKGKEPEGLPSQGAASWQQTSSASASQQGAGERAREDAGEEERETGTKTGRSPDEMLQVARCAREAGGVVSCSVGVACHPRVLLETRLLAGWGACCGETHAARADLRTVRCRCRPDSLMSCRVFVCRDWSWPHSKSTDDSSAWNWPCRPPAISWPPQWPSTSAATKRRSR